MHFFRNLSFSYLMRGAEALSHLIELVRQIANLVIRFNGYLVREVTASTTLGEKTQGTLLPHNAGTSVLAVACSYSVLYCGLHSLAQSVHRGSPPRLLYGDMKRKTSPLSHTDTMVMRCCRRYRHGTWSVLGLRCSACG